MQGYERGSAGGADGAAYGHHQTASAGRSLGAAPLLCPTVEVVPPSDWQALDSALVRPQGRSRPLENLPPPGEPPTLPPGSTVC